MDVKKIFSARKIRLGALSGMGALLLAGALVFANLLASRFFTRFDFTRGGRYSLSAGSRRLLRSLPDPVLFRAYVTAGLPQPYGTQARYLSDLLFEYKSAGGGKVRLEFVNPESSDMAKASAQRAGVTPVRFTQVASDQYQVREGYMGLTISYQDKQEVLPFLKNPDQLEYDVTSRLRKMSRKEKKVLGVLAGHGVGPIENLRNGSAAKLFDSFTVKPVLLSTSALKPDLLFVTGSGGELQPEEVSVLDGYLAEGMPIAVFVSKKTVNLQDFSALPHRTGLDEWLAHYGVRVGEDVVLDAQCQRVTLQSRQNGGMAMANIVNYPPFVLTRPEGGHPITRSLGALGFPFVHPVLPLATGSGLTVTPLARSSAYSWMPMELPSFDPFTIQPPVLGEEKGPFTLAVAVEGSTTSFRDPSGPARVRLAVVGTSYFLEGALPEPAGNADFVARLAGWMVQDEDFVAIPSRGPLGAPLRPVGPFPRALAKAAGYFLLPFLVVFWGLARWRRRQERRPLVEKEWKESLGA